MATGILLRSFGTACRAVAAAFVLTVSGWASAAIALADARPVFIGRFDAANPQAIRFGWSGSTLVFSFEGTTLSVELTDPGTNSFVVEIDGKTSRLDLAKGRQSYVLAKDLPPGPHQVNLIRRTEGFLGPTAYHTASTDGRFTAPLERKRRIMLIGDSIAAGYGVEGRDASCKFSGDTENQYLTYGAMAGRAFDADVVTFARSGYGLVRNFSGDENETMLSIWERTIPTEPRLHPREEGGVDVIIVGLGTNDFHKGPPGPRFETAYNEFLDRLRTLHPQSMIYATIGPLLPAASLEQAAAVIGAIVDGKNASGDKRIGFIHFEAPHPDEYGCDWHPNIAGHNRMAQTLIKRLQSDLLWTPQSRASATRD